MLARCARVQKFVVAPPKPAIVDDAKAHELLSRVIAAVNEIHNSNSSLLSFEELYRYSYNLVLYKQGHLLYDGVANAIRERLEKVSARSTSSRSNSGSHRRTTNAPLATPLLASCRSATACACPPTARCWPSCGRCGCGTASTCGCSATSCSTW